MLKPFVISCLLLGALTVQAQTKKASPARKPATPAKTAAAPATSPKNQSDSLSYAMGISVGQFLKAQGVEELNYEMLNKAISQTLKNDPTLFDINEAHAVMERYARSGMEKKLNAEKEKGRQFMEQNKKRTGVTETASGLQYEVLTAGQGPKPTHDASIRVHYSGKLLDGKEFDSSYSRGEPITISVAGVIAGWTEAVQLMPTGSKWRLYIPSELAYGDSGAGRDIPGGATLIFDVELLEITGQ
ncbi:FKBP-type peptidyl-prolyl cis-trans isomerase [Pontibacter beigongshangensis]|uniref:FKBP-type peptidyl-prolyl cis-trans isomerase n=1 Tax=Pontibacter beigongshangensis TaxID=2574733 RepID=UPI00165021C2|nr:FKBP-type peptidyl-prolyl cis-trans isomerase [Pontibacter beigongshangensis]